MTDKRQKPKKYSSGDDDEWITPENYAQKKLTQNLNKPVEDEPEQEPLPVFVMTSDFSMQVKKLLQCRMSFCRWVSVCVQSRVLKFIASSGS